MSTVIARSKMLPHAKPKMALPILGNIQCVPFGRLALVTCKSAGPGRGTCLGCGDAKNNQPYTESEGGYMKEVKSHLWLIVAVVATGEPNNRPVRQQTAIDCPKDATDVDGDVHVTDADGPKVVWGLCICDGDDRGLNGDPA